MSDDLGYTIPTRAELIDRISSDYNYHLPGEDARVKASDGYALARVHAGGLDGLYGFALWIAAQVIWDRSTRAVLERWAAIFGIARQPAAFAAGPVTITGTSGTTIPAGHPIVRTEDGEGYTTDALATIGAGGSVDVDVTADEAGVDGNAIAGVLVELGSAISGADTECVVAAGGLVDGSDEEKDDALRARLLARVQEPAQGGASSDYEQWAQEVSGVGRVWVSPRELGADTVTVRIAAAVDLDAGDTSADVEPDAALVAAVQAYIDARRPVTAEVFVVGIIAQTVDFTVALTPDNATVRAAVEAELESMFVDEGTAGGTIYASQWGAAISRASGEDHHVASTPAGDIVASSLSHYPVLGTVTWL